MTEGWVLHVKGYRHVVGLYCRQLARNNIYHSVHRVGAFAAFGGEWPHTVIGSVDNAVTVYDEDSFHHCPSSESCFCSAMSKV